MSESKSDVIAKIQKLLALSKSANQHEAELAAQRASDLMAKYQVESSEVEAQSVRSGNDPVVSEKYIVPNQKMKLQWLVTLGHAAAKLYDGTVLLDYGLWGTSFYFVGFKSEVPLMRATFEHLYHSWFHIVESDLAKAKDDALSYRGFAFEPRHTMKFKHGHGQGFAQALYLRCADLANERKAKVQQAANTCTSLVLVREVAVTNWVKQNNIRTVKTKQTRGDNSGYHAGARAGQSIALGGSISTSSNGGYLT